MGSGAQSIYLDKEKARQGARVIYQTAEKLAGKWSPTRSEITTLHTSQPWGDDSTGHKFFDQYSGKDTPAKGKAHTGALDAYDNIIKHMKATAGDIMRAVGALDELDKTIAKCFHNGNGDPVVPK